jgi:cytidyltransferase-like protein
MEKIILCSGGMDPVHSGHIKLLKAARDLGDMLLVGINSDEWLVRKKGAPFMPFAERRNIVSSLEVVSMVYGFDDSDGSASNAIQIALDWWPDAIIVMANGGDRTEGNIPEMERFADNPRVEFAFGVGGEDKANSSSWILNEWKSPKTERPWGYYRKLHQDGPGTHVKELELLPGKQISMQRHRQRSELWVVTTGEATVITAEDDLDKTTEKTYNKHELILIPVGTWHQLLNNTTEIVKIVEVQYGTCCMEEDIERVGVAEGYGPSLYQK